MLKNYINSFVVVTILLLLAIPFQVNAEVEWQIDNTLKPGQPPLDVAVPPNGQWIFVPVSYTHLTLPTMQ